MKGITVLLLTLFLSSVYADTNSCLDNSDKLVKASYESTETLANNPSFKEFSMTTPVIKECVISKLGKQTPNDIVIQAKWEGGTASISSYDSLRSLITLGVDNPISDATSRHIIVFVRTGKEPKFRKLLDANLDKSDASSLISVNYLHEKEPNQKHDIVLMWNDFGSKNHNAMQSLGLSYQYEGIKIGQ